MARVFRIWLPIALVGMIALFFSCASVQQGYRQSANDPQVQLAEDAAQALANGADPSSVLPAQAVDPAKSLAPFLLVADISGKRLASSMTGDLLMPPQGSLDYARDHGENRLTWEPKTGLRLATVIAYHGGSQPGYVIAARSLREVERREGDLARLAVLALAAMLVSSYLVVLAAEWAGKAAKKE